jgi:predicted dehydrogenase
MEKLRAAVIGLGRIGCQLEDDDLREKPCTHAGAVIASDDCVLVGGTDIDPEKRAYFTEHCGVPAYTTASAMIRELRPQIVCIATPPDSHDIYCELAAAENVPLVICEKPMANTLQAAKKIFTLHKSGKIKVLINHERRYAENYRAVRRFLREKTIGEPLSVSAKLYMGRTRRIVDMLWHDGTHLADTIMFLFDDVLVHKKIYPAGLSQTDTVFLCGCLDKRGVPVVIEAGSKRDHLVFEIEISCERGRVKIGNDTFEIDVSAASPYARHFRSLQKISDDFPGLTGYFSNMIRDAAACVHDKAREPESNAVTGFSVIRYLDSIHRW